MKAIVFDQFGGPEVLRAAELPIPDPKPGEVLVHLESAGVCKADWRVRTGRCQWLTAPFPVTLGYEMVGRIAGLGKGVTEFQIGQPVHVMSMACYGTYSEYMAITADDVCPIREGTSFDAAAGAYNYFVANGLLNEVVQTRAGESLYIKGAAGGVGTAVVQMGKMKDMTVIASASTQEKCEYLKRIGADFVFNYKEEDDVEKIRELTGGKGVNYVYDQLAGPDFCRQFDMLATYGQIILYNYLNGYPKDDQIIHILQSRCEGCYGIRYYSIHVHDDDPKAFRKVKEKVLGWISDGKLTPPIYKVLPLEQAAEAHRMLEAGEILGKLVLHP